MTPEAVGVVVGQMLCLGAGVVGLLALIPWVRRAFMNGWREVTRGEVRMTERAAGDAEWGSRSRHPAGKALTSEEILRHEQRETDEGRGDLFNE
jgi:hypothetical protein